MDLTEDKVSTILFRMAAPAALGMFFNTMYNVTDAFWAGRISTEALGALTLSFPFFTILLAVGAGLGSASSALIANALGAKKEEEAKLYHAQALSLAAIFISIFMLVVLLCLPNLLRHFATSKEVHKAALQYIQIILLGSIPMVYPGIINAGLTARGDAKSYRNILIIGFCVNIVLDPLLSLGISFADIQIIPKLGIRGLAIATIITEIITVYYLVLRARKAETTKGQWPRGFILQIEKVRELISQGLPAFINVSSIAMGSFIVNRFVTLAGGDNSLAAYGIAIRIEQIALIPSMGINLALSAVVGQNYGARIFTRIRQAYKISLLMGLGTMLLFYLPLVLLAPITTRFFNSESIAVERIATLYLQIQVTAYMTHIIMFFSGSLLQGMKRPKMILYISLYRHVLAPSLLFTFFIDQALKLFKLGILGVWWGIVIVNWTAAIFFLIYTYRLMNRLSKEPITSSL